MAKLNVTPQPRSTKVKYPLVRQLTILETLCEPPPKQRNLGVTYTPVRLESCLLLQGKWLRQAGFPIGEKVMLEVNPRCIIITLCDEQLWPEV